LATTDPDEFGEEEEDSDLRTEADDEGTASDVEGLSAKARSVVVAAIAESRHLVARLDELLEDLDPEQVTIDDFLDLRAEIGRLNGALNKEARRITKLYGLNSAEACITQYLLNHAGETVEKFELSGVACVLEWARRVRQLDVEHGWQITSGPSGGLKPGQYRLDSSERDEAAAARWALLNGIRRQPGSGESRMLKLLQAAHPESVHRDELDYVAKIGTRDRRKRNLDEAGWHISSWEDDPSLSNGMYRLDSLEQGPPRTREALKLRMQILQDADFSCELCNARPGPGRRVQLQVHHRTFLMHGGSDETENLQVLCRACHAGVHALAEGRVDDELLNPAADPYVTKEGAPPPS
jgi:hypothetical protein